MQRSADVRVCCCDLVCRFGVGVAFFEDFRVNEWGNDAAHALNWQVSAEACAGSLPIPLGGSTRHDYAGNQTGGSAKHSTFIRVR